MRMNFKQLPQQAYFYGFSAVTLAIVRDTLCYTCGN